MRDWFKFRMGWSAAASVLSDEEAGRLFKAVLAFAATGEAPALSGAALGIFTVIAQAMKEDREREAEISAIRSAAGAKGGRPRKAKESNCFPDEKSKKSNCKQLVSEAPEGLRIQALDSVPHLAESREEEGNIYLYSSILPSSSPETNSGPSVEEVAACCRERGYSVDAAEFVDYYATRGWTIGDDPIRDWKAILRIWERNRKERASVPRERNEKDRGSTQAALWPAPSVPAQRYTQRDYSGEDEEAFARMIAAADLRTR